MSSGSSPLPKSDLPTGQWPLLAGPKVSLLDSTLGVLHILQGCHSLGKTRLPQHIDYSITDHITALHSVIIKSSQITALCINIFPAVPPLMSLVHCPSCCWFLMPRPFDLDHIIYNSQYLHCTAMLDNRQKKQADCCW